MPEPCPASRALKGCLVTDVARATRLSYINRQDWEGPRGMHHGFSAELRSGAIGRTACCVKPVSSKTASAVVLRTTGTFFAGQ